MLPPIVGDRGGDDYGEDENALQVKFRRKG